MPNIALDDVMPFGMPPGTYVSDSLMHNTMPTATIQPAIPQFSKGLHLFTLKKAGNEYLDILKVHGFTLKSDKLKVAYLADNFPTDTFNNEYGESFLDKFTQAASSGLADVNQFLGAKTFGQGLENVGAALGDGAAGSFVTGAAGRIKKFQSDMAAKAKAGGAGAGVANTMLQTANAVLAGARVDFPQVWKNSGFAPSYTMTVRLYNPNPASPDDTRKYIVGPLAALLLLGTPVSAPMGEGSTYQWPFLCKVRSPGIYHLNAAYINSISVIKGGDQQSIAWNQALAVVDVRIDFGSLFNSILAETKKGSIGNEKRPTLATYLEAVGGQETTEKTSNGAGRRTVSNVYVTPPLGRYSEYSHSRDSDEEKLRLKQNSGYNTQVKAQKEIDGNVTPRRSSQDLAAVEALRNASLAGDSGDGA